MDFKRLFAMAFAVGSLTIVGCPDDTTGAVETEGGTGTGGDATGPGPTDPTITTTIGMTSVTGMDDGTAAPTTTDPTLDGTGADDGGSGDCCTAHATAGCENDTCESSVCAMNASCCAFEWNADCVDLAARLCDGCTGGNDTGSTGGGDGTDDGGNMDQCCEPTAGVTGCPNGPLENCVCAIDDYCCMTEWDAMCVDVATGQCGANCPVTKGDCCSPGNAAGCMDDTCEAAVCAVDDFCCGTQWDQFCAAAASGICEMCGAADGDCCTANGMQGCSDDPCVYFVCDNNGNPFDASCCTDGWTQTCADEAVAVCPVCGGGVDPDDCCAANGNMGCGDQACEDAVCAVDSYCCTDEWDGSCAAMAAGICSTCGAADGECCGPTGTQGCNDDACVATICGFQGFDPDCCTNGWTQACADAANDTCLACAASDCCVGNGGLGCEDDACETAICAADPFCCSDGWDQLCGAEAQGFCAVCGGGMGNCCEANGSQGCNDAECVFDICSNGGEPVDPACCTDTWTQACADAAMTAGCVCNP